MTLIFNPKRAVVMKPHLQKPYFKGQSVQKTKLKVETDRRMLPIVLLLRLTLSVTITYLLFLFITAARSA